jgi:phenylacetate-coenzyme A ligase PaaK-like adenylate-forming protein
MDNVKLEVEMNETSHSNQPKGIIAELETGLGHKIKNKIGITMQVEIKDFNTIPRSEGGKLSRIKDVR